MGFKIFKYGSPILRKKAIEVDKNEDITSIAANLFSTLKKEGGLGLAGPQAGMQKQIFIIDTSPLAEDEDATVSKVEKVVINPEIISFGEKKEYYNEGCLSIPEIYEDVLRPEAIKVRYNDVDFNVVEEDLEGIEARIFQHEYDHLEGVLFIDRISSLRRKLLAGKLKKIRKK